MRRRTLSLLSIATFTIFTILGYLTSSNGFPRHKPLAVGMYGPTSTAIAVQNNLLLIHVDRLYAARPVLKAAWIAGYFRSPNQTVLTFYPLLSETASQVAQVNLKAVFSLNPDGSPGQAFTQAVAIRGIKTSGYLVVDDGGMDALDEFFHNEESPVIPPTPSSTPRLLDASCRYILAGAVPQPSGRRFDWKAFSGHLHSNLTYNDLHTSWVSMQDSSHPIRCKILP